MAQELNVADLRISSSAFNGHGPIPKRHTGDDDDVSPALEWSGVPDGTKAFALVVHDPDAPLVDGFTHWVAYGIPGDTTGLAEEAPMTWSPARTRSSRPGSSEPTSSDDAMVVVAKDIKRLLAEAGVDEASLQVHKRLAGKIGVTPKVELTEETLELLYTPGIGAVSRRLGGDPHDARDLTWKGNAVAVVSDESTVLGLGDEGPVAAMPVLEGKALLFRALAVVATGRSDHPNQVNNVLAFPGLFRGALDARLSEIDEKALLRAAHALAGLVESPTADSILPGVLDERVVPAVAAAVPESSRPR